MGCYWANFAETGSPNQGSNGCVDSLKIPQWPALGANGTAMVFGNTSITPVESVKKQRCDLLNKYLLA